MKNLVNALTGKKALTFVTIAAVLFTILEVATDIRLGVKIDFVPMIAIFTAITAWAAALANRKNK